MLFQPFVDWIIACVKDYPTVVGVRIRVFWHFQNSFNQRLDQFRCTRGFVAKCIAAHHENDSRAYGLLLLLF